MDPSKTPFDEPGFSGKSERAAGEASSATGIFGTVPAASTPPQDDDILQSLMRKPDAPASVDATRALPQSSPLPQTAPPAMAPAVAPPAFAPAATSNPSAPAGPGEFTQILRALNASPSDPPVPAKPAGDLASVFKQVSFEKTPLSGSIASPAPPQSSSAPSSPGSFTQMFSTLTAKTVEEQSDAKPAPPLPVTQPWQAVMPEAAPVPSQASGPGDFTKMFQAMPAEARSMSRTPVLPVAPPPQSQPSAGPGSFTQMFSTLSPVNSPQEDPLKSLKAEPIPPNNFQFSAPLRSPEPSAQGGFTQLLEALNKEQTATVKAAEPLMAAPPLAAPSPAAGGFTQLLRTLSAEPASQPATPPLPQMVQQAPVAPPPSSGPSEFTRIISGSALRDLQGGSAGSVPPVAGPSAGRPAFAPMPLPPAPHMPPMPQFQPHAGAAAPPPMPHLTPAAFAFPPAPAPPAAPVPEPGKIQKYLPLILVLNVFVLLVIVLILFFTMHHK